MKTYKVAEIREESPGVKSFFFGFKEPCEPGQFLMVWVPGVDEVPMSVSFQDKGRLGISVHNVGEATAAMHNLKVGDLVGLRGPYGNTFDIKGEEVLLVGGGCGAAPLIHLAETAKRSGIKVKSLVGACTRDEVLFEDRYKECGDLECSTDDGSFGYNGFVTDLVEKELGAKKYDCVYTCGPEIMMKKVFGICEKNKIEVQASLERYMKCGVGVCSSCAVNGYRVCRDGPVFGSEKLRKMGEFGRLRRVGSGVGVKI